MLENNRGNVIHFEFLQRQRFIGEIFALYIPNDKCPFSLRQEAIKRVAELFRTDDYKDEKWFNEQKLVIEEEFKQKVYVEPSLSEDEADFVYFVISMTMDTVRARYMKQDEQRAA